MLFTLGVLSAGLTAVNGLNTMVTSRSRPITMIEPIGSGVTGQGPAEAVLHAAAQTLD
jgi:hypothetical protein